MKESKYLIPKELGILLKKKIFGKDFVEAKTINKEDSLQMFQLFEVMIGETINAIFNDFIWHTSSIQGDGGIDFYGEKMARELPFNWKKPPLIIYGQVKFRSGSIRKSEIESATKAIIDYHRHNTLQKKSIYEIIHVIKSSKLIDISYGEAISISNLDTRHYMLNIINADDFFKIWILNKKFLRKLLPTSLSVEERNLILNYFKNINICWDELFETSITYDLNQSIEHVFSCKFTINNKMFIPTELIIKLVPAPDNVLSIVNPVRLISLDGLNIKIFNRYDLEIKFLPTEIGTASLGILKVFDTEMNLLYKNNLGTVEIDSKFNPTYFSVPNYKINAEIKRSIIDSDDNLILYSVIGEGGIGKSILINDISIFAVNHGFKFINYEHICEFVDDNMFLSDLFLSIIGIKEHYFFNIEEKMQYVRRFFGIYYCEEWSQQLYTFLDTGYYSNLNIIMDCWISALLLITDQQPLFIHLSNLHWSSPNLIVFLNALVKTLKNKSSYFNRKVVMVFEGRISEIVYSDFKKHVPYEWINFTQNGYTKKLQLKKWSDDDCRIYITSLFIYNGTPDLQKKASDRIIDKIIDSSRGNPMHINEMMRHLLETNCLTSDHKGKIRVLNFESEEFISQDLLDIIKLRITYFALKYSDVMDYIIIYLNVEECDSLIVSKTIFDKLSERYDIGNLFREMEFLFIEDSIIKVSHEHYRNALKGYKISNSNNIYYIVNCTNDKGTGLSPISLNRLLLMADSPDYIVIAKNITELLRKEQNIHARYSLLLLLYKIPESVLVDLYLPRYELLNSLQDASMNLGDWNTAIEYIEQIKEMHNNTHEYMLVRSKSQLALSNIYGIKLDLYKAITVVDNAINELEQFIATNKLSDKEMFQFLRVLSLLYNRLAIEYYMSGQRELAERTDLKALEMSKKNRDEYVEYHIMYEKGVRLLHTNAEEGEKHILKAKENIKIPTGFLIRQELDLVCADHLMAQLIYTQNYYDDKIIDIYSESQKLCNELSTIQEPFESALLHTICAITCVLRHNYDQALRFFYIAATTSEKASLDSLVWKSYLNIAQLYLLLAATTGYENYKSDAVFYAIEAKQIINRGVIKNPQIHSQVEIIFKYPLAIVDSIINNTNLQFDKDSKVACALHVDYLEFSFFLLD